MSLGHQIQYNAPWHDLKKICVGNTYDTKFYEPVKNLQVRDALQRIASETIEDYKNLIKIGKSSLSSEYFLTSFWKNLLS